MFNLYIKTNKKIYFNNKNINLNIKKNFFFKKIKFNLTGKIFK